MQKYLFFFLALFTVILGFYYSLAYSNLSGNDFVYPLDDAYIHLTIARNFAENGFWGVNADSFDSASSSILYTLILSLLIKLFGDNVYYPMIINIIAGYGTVYYCYRYFSLFYGKKELLLGLALLIPFCQLYMMVILGMEQTLHILLTVMMIYYIKKNLRSDFAKRDFWKLLLVSTLFGAIRFESMFFVLILAVLLSFRGKWKAGLGILTAGFFPIVFFGFASLKSGGYFFPNSLLMKGNYPESSVFVSLWNIFRKGILTNASFYKLFIAPLAMFGVYFLWKYKNQDWRKILKNETLIILMIGTIILHSLFAVIRYRYENYLMAGIILVVTPIVITFFQNIRDKKDFNYIVVILTSFSGVVLYSIYISVFNHRVIKYASKNIQEQQIEMARFLNNYYNGQKVVANDIGAISYFSNISIFDIAGLASTNVAGFYMENKQLDPKVFDHKYHQFMSRLIDENHYKIAIIYPKWFPEGVPSSWIPIASWTIEKKMGVANQTVVWYALNKNEVEDLRKNLKNFNLNKNVTQYYYSNK